MCILGLRVIKSPCMVPVLIPVTESFLDATLQSIGRPLLGRDLLGSVVGHVVQYKVSGRNIEVKTGDLSPLTLRHLRIKHGTVETMDAICVCVYDVVEQKEPNSSGLKS